MRCTASCVLFFFFFKQKTAYEITYGDWSSDVCSSDLGRQIAQRGEAVERGDGVPAMPAGRLHRLQLSLIRPPLDARDAHAERMSSLGRRPEMGVAHGCWPILAYRRAPQCG